MKLRSALLGIFGAVLTITGVWYIIKALGKAEEPPPETKYKLYIDTGVGGTTDPAPGAWDYALNTVVEIKALPNSGYVFDYFTVDGLKRILNPWSVTMNAAHSVVAYFKVAGSNKYTLKISTTQGGTTNPAPGSYEYDPGAQVTITATPITDFQFASWIIDNDVDTPVTGNPITLTMSDSHIILANFLTNISHGNITAKPVDENGYVLSAQIFLDGNLVGTGQVTLTGLTYGLHTFSWGPQIGYTKPDDSTFLNIGTDQLIVGLYVHAGSTTYVLGVTANVWSNISKIKLHLAEQTVYVKKGGMTGPVIASKLTDVNGYCEFDLLAGGYYVYCPTDYGTNGQQLSLPPAVSIEILFITGGF